MLFHLSSVIQFSWSSVGGSSAQPQETAGKKLSWMSKLDCIWKVKIVSLFSEWDLNRASTLKISTEKIYLKPRTVLIVPGLLTPEPSSAPLRSVVAVAAAWVYHLRLGKIIYYSWHIRSCRIWTNHLCKISIITFAWTILYTTHCEKSCKVNILQFQNISDELKSLKTDLGTMVASEGGGLGKETK